MSRMLATITHNRSTIYVHNLDKDIFVFNKTNTKIQKSGPESRVRKIITENPETIIFDQETDKSIYELLEHLCLSHNVDMQKDPNV